MGHRLIEGDCVEAMAAMEECSVDAVVCDPPYGLEFMGKEWDRLGGEGWRAGGGFTKPGIGERETPWASYGAGDTANATCVVCGGRMRGAKRCECDDPDWRVKGKPLEAAGADSRQAQGRKMQEWHERWAREALRVLKPGGHLLAFGGTRTYHRLACAVEDAGFEVRDTICWLYGSGFPKSLDVSKAIDAAASAERPYQPPNGKAWNLAADRSRPGGGGTMGTHKLRSESMDVTAPATPEAEQWSGWGTALKPAHEPIVVARKPLAGTVAGNVLEHGTGALNVDGCRIDAGAEVIERDGDFAAVTDAHDGYTRPGASKFTHKPSQRSGPAQAAGRWPANVVLDGEAADMLDAQSGESKSTGGRKVNISQASTIYGGGKGLGQELSADVARGDPGFGDVGGASRFFYVAKASRAERNAGLHSTARANHHPTVKPIALMRWLVRLVTPPGGTVLDPFAGSGTTGCAAAIEGVEFVGVEREAEYVAIARTRIELAKCDPGAFEPEERARRAAAAAKVATLPTAEQYGLFDDEDDDVALGQLS